MLGLSERYRWTNFETKSNAYHDSITNGELNVISAREIEELLNQSKKILQEKLPKMSKIRKPNFHKQWVIE